MTVALRAESRKLLTTQVWFWMFVLQLGLTLLVACLVSAFSKTTDTGVPIESVLNGVVGFSVLIASVLGVIGITGEYRHLTATPTFLSVPRRGTVINVIRDGVKSDSDEPLLDGVPVIPKGEKLGGQFFPLLFDPEFGLEANGRNRVGTS